VRKGGHWASGNCFVPEFVKICPFDSSSGVVAEVQTVDVQDVIRIEFNSQGTFFALFCAATASPMRETSRSSRSSGLAAMQWSGHLAAQ
jgi:hypothetical protein